MPDSQLASSPLPAVRWSAWILPYSALVLFVGAIAAMLWLVHRHESDIQLNNLRRDTQYAELSITRKLLAHQDFAHRLASGLSSHHLHASLRDQAEAYVADNPEVRNVVWGSADGMSGWSAPAWKDLVALDRERPPMEERDRLKRMTRSTQRAQYSDPYRDHQGEPYIEYHTPVFEGARFAGTLAMTVSLRTAMQRLVPPQVTEKYRLSLLDSEGRELFRHADSRETSDMLTQSMSLALPWRNVTLSATSYKSDTMLGRAVMAGIILGVSIVLAWSLWSLRRRVELQAEADIALKASHERFVTVLDALDAGVVVSDFDSREVLFCNDAFTRLFPGFGVGSSAADVEAPFMPLPSTAVPRSTLIDARGRPTGVHRVEVHEPVRDLWYVLRIRAVRWVDGRLVRLTMISDITDRKQAEERNRVQQEKLLLTSRLMSVGEMASTLAHEINQPLSAIANYNMGAVRRLKSDHWKKEELVSALEKSAAQAERAGRVVQRVREFLRRREPVRAVESIDAIVHEVAELIELEAEKTQVRLTVDLAPDMPPVNVDHIMIEQLMLNLIKNGLEAMKRTPVAERKLLIRTVRQDDHVEVQVLDRGHGIPPEVERELFAPFFTTKKNGMGMGLNICRSIVELHEGRLWFSANPAGGSVFHFTLPLALVATGDDS